MWLRLLLPVQYPHAHTPRARAGGFASVVTSAARGPGAAAARGGAAFRPLEEMCVRHWQQWGSFVNTPLYLRSLRGTRLLPSLLQGAHSRRQHTKSTRRGLWLGRVLGSPRYASICLRVCRNADSLLHGSYGCLLTGTQAHPFLSKALSLAHSPGASLSAQSGRRRWEGVGVGIVNILKLTWQHRHRLLREAQFISTGACAMLACLRA